MKTQFKYLLIAAFVSTNLQATCLEKDIIFFCTTKKGKQVEVCDRKKTIEYSFGKINQKPEMALNIPRSKAKTFQWNGLGSWMSYSVDIPNNNTVYNIFWGVNRNDENHPIEAGVNVFIKGKLAATIECSDNIINNMEGVDLPLATE